MSNVEKHVDVLIVGYGTAALAAASQVKRVTDNFVIVSNGVYGTTCVRTGCMPSKLLIRASELYWERNCMPQSGIVGGENIRIDRRKLMEELRERRTVFLEYTLKASETYRDHIVEGEAYFISLTDVRVGKTLYRAKRIILATGSRPIVPPEWKALSDYLLTSDSLFEQETLPDSLGIIQLSVLGTEIGQALGKIGLTITAFHDGGMIGGLSDAEINDYAIRHLRNDMDIRLWETVTPALEDKAVRLGAQPVMVDKLFVAMSREANLGGMGLEELGLISPHSPIMQHDPETMQVGDLPIYIAGDVKLGRSILSEATDEGRIAGYNAARQENTRFRRRTPLLIAYTHPTIAIAGQCFAEYNPARIIIGEARFDDQGRAKIMGLPSGIIRLYADRESGVITGSEMFVPMGEHIGHMVAWLIDRKLTVDEALQLPFYHPSIEEGLRTALLDARSRLGHSRPLSHVSQLQS